MHNKFSFTALIKIYISNLYVVFVYLLLLYIDSKCAEIDLQQRDYIIEMPTLDFECVQSVCKRLNDEDPGCDCDTCFCRERESGCLINNNTLLLLLYSIYSTYKYIGHSRHRRFLVQNEAMRGHCVVLCSYGSTYSLSFNKSRCGLKTLTTHNSQSMLSHSN